MNVGSHIRGYGFACLDIGCLIWIWAPVSGSGIPYLDMGLHIWMWEPKPRYGIPYPDTECHIQMWLFTSRSGHPYRDGQIRFQYGRHALPGGGGRDSPQNHRENIVFRMPLAAEGIAGKHNEIGSHIKAHFIRFPTSSF